MNWLRWALRLRKRLETAAEDDGLDDETRRRAVDWLTKFIGAKPEEVGVLAEARDVFMSHLRADVEDQIKWFKGVRLTPEIAEVTTRMFGRAISRAARDAENEMTPRWRGAAEGRKRGRAMKIAADAQWRAETERVALAYAAARETPPRRADVIREIRRKCKVSALPNTDRSIGTLVDVMRHEGKIVGTVGPSIPKNGFN